MLAVTHVNKDVGLQSSSTTQTSLLLFGAFEFALSPEVAEDVLFAPSVALNGSEQEGNMMQCKFLSSVTVPFFLARCSHFLESQLVTWQPHTHDVISRSHYATPGIVWHLI